MHIIRFFDADGKIQLGIPKDPAQPSAGPARLLSGDLFTGLLPTDRTTEVIKLLAPLVPVNILCIGANYAAHAKESGIALQDNPVVFMKATSSLNHPGDPIRIPKCQMKGPEVDFEAELAVVIGRPARDVPEHQALDYVLGYTCGHDVSARRWQKQGGGGQWVRGKSFDTFCPLGPVLVTAGEIPNPQTLAISSTLNGQVMQSSNTSHMTHTVARLISFLSQDTTLLPGTVIMTGTPEGVGFARDPAVFLKAGDMMVVEIQNIGRLQNPVA